MDAHRFNLVKTILKTANLRILYALKDGKRRWSEFERLMNKRQVSDSLNELIRLGLVQTIEQQRGLQIYRVYALTPLGHRVLEKLEEIEGMISDNLEGERDWKSTESDYELQ